MNIAAEVLISWRLLSGYRLLWIPFDKSHPNEYGVWSRKSGSDAPRNGGFELNFYGGVQMV